MVLAAGAELREGECFGLDLERVGEGLHPDLVVHAAEDGLSLNRYVVKKLSST